MKTNGNNPNNINEEYLQEMEANNKLFEEKIKNLNNIILNNNNQNKDKDIKNKKDKNKIKTLEDKIFYHKNTNKKNIDKNNNNNIDIDDLNKYTFKKKDNFHYNKENSKDNNKFNINNNNLYENKNIELKNKIKQLEKDNNFKEYLINDLRNQIKDKNKKEKISHIKCNEYNSLLKDVEDKNHKIEKLENNIKYLKLEIDNLLLDNKKLAKENEALNNKNEEINSQADYNKIDSLNYLQKINDLKLENKKLNIELLNSNNELNILKEENEKLKSKIAEQNTIIYNYQKSLNTKTFNTNTNRLNSYDKINNYINENDNDNPYKTFTLRKYDTSEKYNYSPPKRYKGRDIEIPEFTGLRKKKNNYFKEKENDYNHFDDFDDNDYNGKKYNYYRNDYGDGTLDYITEKNREIKKSEINYLENYLSSLFKERTNLQNELYELPAHPRTLSDIKLKNNISDKISQNNSEIQSIKNKLKKIRGY